MSIDKQIIDLFALASEQGRSDVMQAIGKFIPLSALIEKAKSSCENLSPGLAQAILESDYDASHARELCSANPLQYEPVRDLLVDMAEKGPEPVRWEIVIRLVKEGYGKHALAALQTVEDVEGMKAEAEQYRSYFARNKAEYHFSVTTSPYRIDRTMLKVHDVLDIDVPGDFTGEYGSASRGERSAWSPARLDSMMNWVSDVVEAESLGIPAAVNSPNGMSINNGAMAHAWMAEYQRVQGMGKWHRDNFPAHFPVLADPSTAPGLAQLGAVEVKPVYEYSTIDRYSNNEVARPTHGFEPAIEASLSKAQIRLATSLLPYDTIHDLRKPGAQSRLMLVPFELMQELNVSCDALSDELRLAMRFHRPEVLINTHYSVQNNASNGVYGAKLYLRGMTLEDNDNLNLWRGAQNPAVLKHYDSPAEIQMLRDAYSPQRHPSDTKTLSLRETVPGDPSASIKKCLERLTQVSSYLGFEPRVSIVGSRPFVESITHAKVDFNHKPHIVIKNDRGETESYEESKVHNFSDTRMYARVFPPAHLANRTVAELIGSAVRLKDKDEIAKVCGVLDRFEPHEIFANGTTKAKALFLKNHFDFKDRVDELPSPMKNIVGREVVEAEFGL